MSAPTGDTPCGHRAERSVSEGSDQRTIADILNPLCITAQKALSLAQDFSHDWVGKVFHKPSIEAQHRDWKSQKPDWLPSDDERRKNLGESISEEVLQRIIEEPLERTLRLVHRNMQIYAVGLEVAFMEQQKFKGNWTANFTQMHTQNNLVLCELEDVIYELSNDGEKIDRNVISPEYRSTLFKVSKNLRDWFILRDYMANLEYIIDLCRFVMKISPSEQE